MGRPRKAVELRVLEGSFKPSRHGPLPEVAPETVPPPTKPRGLTKEQSRFWDEIAPTLIGVVRDRDKPLLAEMCRWWVRAQVAGRKLDRMKPGSVEYGRILRQASEASATFDRMAKRFGMTPSDRAQLRAEQVAPSKAKVATRPRTKLGSVGG